MKLGKEMKLPATHNKALNEKHSNEYVEAAMCVALKHGGDAGMLKLLGFVNFSGTRGVIFDAHIDVTYEIEELSLL